MNRGKGRKPGRQTREMGDPIKRVFSIRKRLRRMIRTIELKKLFFTDFVAAAALVAGRMVGIEKQAGILGVTDQVERMLMPGEKTIFYRVTRGGENLVLDDLAEPARVFLIILAALTLFQLTVMFFSSFSRNRRIEIILNPINEIALQADALSKLSFSEDKFRRIEDAITNLRPQEETPLSFHDGDLAGVEAAMNNLVRRMHDVYREQARFVDDASHELRTPIAVIQGYASLLERWGKRDENVLDESIAAIANESDHMNHLVEQLLFLARGDSGRTSLKPETFCLGQIVEELYEESRMIDENHDYQLQKFPEELWITADEGLIKQAARILTDNAAKYTTKGHEIRLGVYVTGSKEPAIMVEDTGIGIADSDLPHLFERFYRADDARAYTGTGLGLSIAKWIVDRHGGHFEVISREGIGTRIAIVLPRHRLSTPPRAEAES